MEEINQLSQRLIQTEAKLDDLLMENQSLKQALEAQQKDHKVWVSLLVYVELTINVSGKLSREVRAVDERA